MCGIAAHFAYDGPSVDRGALVRTRDAMARRGPDGSGLWVSPDERTALAHRRLSIIDLSEAGAQPMTDGTRTVTFNGEIYNYRALRTELEARGRVFRTQSDTEVLLHGYAVWGARVVEHLRGMFAFVLHDADRSGVLLARDPYGIKPLYLADDGRTLRIASQVKALLAGGGVDTAPEPAGHAGFFLWGHVPEPFTLYRGIRALPAGHTLWADADGPRPTRRYFDLAATLGAAEKASVPDDPAADVRAGLLDTVRHHLEADVEVGVFLSSGRDSATLAALATEAGSGRVRTVTLGFEEFRGSDNDEVPLAEAIARHYGTDHATVWVTRADFEDAAEHVLEVMDQPTLDGVNTYFVSRAAAQAGLKVALSGLGGDELFGGYESFQSVPRLVRALRGVPAGAMVGRGLRVVAAPVVRRVTSAKYAGLLEYGGQWGGAYLLRRSLYMPWELPSVLDPDLAREGLARLDTLACLAETTEGLSTDAGRLTALESAWYMRNQLLRDSDWASMAHSLEVRVPLVDAQLLHRLGPAVLRGGAGKATMAAAARPMLPSAVLERPKTGFTIPVREWMATRLPVGERGLRGWARFIHSTASTRGTLQAV